jgi:hypothetical protein
MKLEYAEAKQIRDVLDADLRRTSAELQKFPKGTTGLTPDDVKATPEYQAAKHAAETAFARLRRFNTKFVRAFKSELKAEYTARLGGL